MRCGFLRIEGLRGSSYEELRLECRLSCILPLREVCRLCISIIVRRLS
jgi:hypothetical protein